MRVLHLHQTSEVTADAQDGVARSMDEVVEVGIEMRRKPIKKVHYPAPRGMGTVVEKWHLAQEGWTIRSLFPWLKAIFLPRVVLDGWEGASLGHMGRDPAAVQDPFEILENV